MNNRPYPYNADQEAWLRDLETTEEPQVKEYLHISGGRSLKAGFCCLGRACVVLGVKTTGKNDDLFVAYDGCDQVLTDPTIDRLLLRGTNGDFRDRWANGNSCLTDLNDRGMSFKEIAAYIRANPWNVFKDPEEQADG